MGTNNNRRLLLGLGSFPLCSCGTNIERDEKVDTRFMCSLRFTQFRFTQREPDFRFGSHASVSSMDALGSLRSGSTFGSSVMFGAPSGLHVISRALPDFGVLKI